MANVLSELTHESRLAAASLSEATLGFFNPTIRLGVTGLSRAGKTVFITALIDALTRQSRLSLLSAAVEGRIAHARLEPQPDLTVPRFDYERHLATILAPEREWPQSTSDVSELRLVIDYQPAGWFGRTFGLSQLSIDIVDYPGEWLLDLALLGKSYAQWSEQALTLSRLPTRLPLAAPWHAAMAKLDPNARYIDGTAIEPAAIFTAYLRACRDERVAQSTLPPGRFLLPGAYQGSPALAFVPLPVTHDTPDTGSLHAHMARCFEAYKDDIVRPFFRKHFARLDRQIVLVDALSALNAGPSAVADLERALADILSAFRVGQNSWWSSLFSPRIDKILFAATKADHLHHRDHDRLEAILARLVAKASQRAQFSGAAIDVIALAAIRATREARLQHGSEMMDAVIGVPMAGERVDGEVFDGQTEVALFPGDLPSDPQQVLTTGIEAPNPHDAALRFLRFRPPLVAANEPLPHIRLDRALQFMIGDKLA